MRSISGRNPSRYAGRSGGPKWRIARWRRRSCSGGVQADKLIRIRGGPWSSPGLRTVSQIGTDAGVMQQRLDLAIGTHDVRPPLVGAIFLKAYRGLAQLRPQRVRVRAIGSVVDLL